MSAQRLDFVPTLYKCYTNVLCLLGGYRVCALALVHFCSKQNLLTRCHHSDTTQRAASSVNRANLLGVKNSCISDQGPCTLCSNVSHVHIIDYVL